MKTLPRALVLVHRCPRVLGAVTFLGRPRQGRSVPTEVHMCIPVPPTDALKSTFLSILPRIELHARISSRTIKCAHKRADFISEVVSLSWKWWIRLHERGKDPSGFV